MREAMSNENRSIGKDSLLALQDIPIVLGVSKIHVELHPSTLITSRNHTRTQHLAPRPTARVVYKLHVCIGKKTKVGTSADVDG